jgi:hypothetical protein
MTVLINRIIKAMYRISTVLVAGTWVLFFLAPSCTKVTTMDGGSGTGVGNGVVMGKVIYPDSTPVKGALVRLRTQNYLADTSGKVPSFCACTLATVYTDSFGMFSIDSIETKHSFCVEVLDHKQQVLGTLYKTIASISDTLQLGTRVVHPVTKISGSILLSGLPHNAYVQIYGLERLGRTDSTGHFEIQELPLGECEHGECEYKLRIFAPQATGGIKVVETELEVNSDPNGNVLSIELEFGSDG